MMKRMLGFCYHLDAMQGVSFPDLNKNPTTQTIAPPCKNTGPAKQAIIDFVRATTDASSSKFVPPQELAHLCL